MADTVQWEYIFQTVGSVIKGPKDEEVAALLNAWGAEGWELVAAVSQSGGSAIKLVAKRPLSTTARRRRSMPGEEGY